MMLIELFGQNFGPFRDEFRLSLLASDIDRGNPRGVVEVPLEREEQPLRLLRCAAIYGPNASGKSWALKAASALAYVLTQSSGFESDQPIGPFEPFLLDESSRSRPVRLGVRAAIDSRVYEYVIEFKRTRFVREKLAELAPDQDRILLDRREQEVSGQWTRDKQFGLLTESFRPNALLLSLADRLAPRLAGRLAVGIRNLLDLRDFSWNLPAFFASRHAAERASRDRKGFGTWLAGWLAEADVGIADYETEEVRIPVPAESTDDRHESGAGQRPETLLRLRFIHAGTERTARLNVQQESAGTLKMVELAPYIYDLMHGTRNKAYFIDELAASVHPVLLRSLITEFNCEAPPDSVRGQLVFATHETSLLDAEAKNAPLRRDQIYLTEKESGGACHLSSIVEFKERNNLNLRRRYLQGRYGALPAPGRLGV
jgi:hypothetical protein